MGNSKYFLRLDPVCRALVRFCYDYYLLVGLVSLVVLFYVGFLQYKLRHHRQPRPPAWYENVSHVELRRRYADFIFVRLVIEIEKIDRKYLEVGARSISEEALLRAHDELQAAVELFRNDAMKLLTPNELEISMPMELVYGITDDEERLLRSRCRSMNIQTDDRFLSALLQATPNSSD